MGSPPFLAHHHVGNKTHHHHHRRWSWREMQEDYYNCTNGTSPEPRVDRYVRWRSTSALGNALNVWVHAFLYALATGRQLLVGEGVVPELFCGPDGAYACGPAYAPRGKMKSVPIAWHRIHEEQYLETAIHDALPNWFSYKSVGAALYRGAGDDFKTRLERSKCAKCVWRALRCPEKPFNGIDKESCAMVRAMQFLLPGTLLKANFADKALRTASQRWTGDLNDLKTVLKHSTSEEEEEEVPGIREQSRWSEAIFYDPPSSSFDASTRFAGALHLRTLPPKLENHVADKSQQLTYLRFIESMNATMEPNFWMCAAQNALETDARMHQGHWPRSIFLATDAAGICRIARNRISFGSISCMDVDPVHMTKDVRHEATNVLDPHQLVVLDWHLLARSRWLVSIGRTLDHCAKGASRDGTHGVGGPGRSFFGWALAASGLAHPPPGVHTKGCACTVNDHTVSVWYPHDDAVR